MSLLKSIGFTLMLPILNFSSVDSASAQQSTVFVTHSPSLPIDARITYQLHSHDQDTRFRGLPRRLVVPEGGKACFIVENANPVLYQYTVGSVVLTVDPPAELGTIQGALDLLASVSAASLPGFQNPNDPSDAEIERTLVATYAVAVGALDRYHLQLRKARLESDREPSLEISAGRVAVLADSARIANENAETVYKRAWPNGTELPAASVLRASQIASAAGARAIADEFTQAKQAAGTPLCIDVDGQMRKMFLTVKPKPNGPEKPARTIGDSLVQVEIEPRSTRVIEIGAGYLLSAYTSGAQQFSLTNGSIQKQDNDGVGYAPAVFLLGRAWDQEWLWGTIGASAGEDGLSSMFFGLSGRFGPTVVGTRFTLGAGLSLIRVPVGLKEGASVGEPLPANIDNIEDVVATELRPGLGITLMLSSN